MSPTLRLTGLTNSNLDESTHAPQILALVGTFWTATAIVIAARMYVKGVMLKSVGLDDWIMLSAMACATGMFATFIGQTHHGLGKHTASISYPEMVQMQHWQYFTSITVTVGISLVKLSIGFFLLRLVTNKAYKRALYGVNAFLIAFTFSSAGTIAFSCVNPIRASWDPLGEPGAKCFDNKTFTDIGLFNSAINIATDIVFASMPIPVVWNLQVNMRTKISLVAILSLGYFACIASIVKLTIQVNFLSDQDSTRNDAYFMWNAVELYIGILAASLPALRPLFRTMLDNTRDYRTRRTGSSGITGGARHKYYVHEDGIGMDSLAQKKRYDVRVSTKHAAASSGNSSTEQIVKETDPYMGGVGVTTTVNVSVSKDGVNHTISRDSL